MALSDTRREQMFPKLTAPQMATARRFASDEERRFGPGELIYQVGQKGVPAWLVLGGSVDVVRQDGMGNSAPIVSHGPGELTGETGTLSGQAGLASATAGSHGALAIPFDAAHLRALVIGSADLGEMVMRAYILRRVALIEAGASGGAGSVLLGRNDSPDLIRLSGFLTRNGYPHTTIAACQSEGQELVGRLGLQADDLPIMICPNGTVLKRPTDAEAASCLGIAPDLDPAKLYDVAVIGAGPAGLATAVYGASEGLSVLVLDSRAFGGQAGASARIENYLGFPTGISGQALAGRAYNQATKFGAELAIPVSARSLQCERQEGVFALDLSEGQTARARTVVIASGAQYRRLPIANLEQLEGTGISYWASPLEAKLCAGHEIALVGGGNSAGQAVVFLAGHARKLHLIVRRPLTETMSQYLVDRIQALDNVEIHLPCEISALEGDEQLGLRGARIRDRRSGGETHLSVEHLFLFIGADPNTAWLNGCVKLDSNGFVLTGTNARFPLETSRRGVFAAGDVRAGSTKRVAAAVGEGAAVIAQIHAYLAQSQAEDRAS